LPGSRPKAPSRWLATTPSPNTPGPHVYSKGCHRDSVRSTHSFTAFRWGHKWVVLAVLVRFPFATRPWAMPLLVALYQPEEENRVHPAGASEIKMLQLMAKTLAAHRSGLLAYYDGMITSGPMEGTNNKIKTMKRQAYGFQDREFFKLKILAIH
jgi:hypothetical protein